jgi:hypothetical protein
MLTSRDQLILAPDVQDKASTLSRAQELLATWDSLR